MKTIEFKYLVISYDMNDEMPNSFRAYKHEGSAFFKRFSKVIELTLYNRTLIFEF